MPHIALVIHLILHISYCISHIHLLRQDNLSITTAHYGLLHSNSQLHILDMAMCVYSIAVVTVPENSFGTLDTRRSPSGDVFPLT